MALTGQFELRSEENASGVVAIPSVVRVLAVDDDFPACKLLSAVFAPPAYYCVTARSGEEALVLMQREKFDVIISDLRMPGIDGMGLLAEARREHPYVAFLVITGVDDVETGIRAIRSGADDYLVKPMLQEAVLMAVQRALEKRHLARQVDEYRRNLEEIVTQRTSQLQEGLQRIEYTYEATLQALGAAVDLRDGETEGHCQRVCAYSIETAKVMGLSGAQLDDIARGAYLHDIGKLGVPDGILLKPGPLTMEERRFMQRHVQFGFDLIKDIPFLAHAAEITLTHHERFDGDGYPRGLKAEEIPLGGRIFSVADAFDAITSNRPYRSASPFEVGREIIRREAGKQFDPDVAAAFLSIPDERWRPLQSAISVGFQTQL